MKGNLHMTHRHLPIVHPKTAVGTGLRAVPSGTAISMTQRTGTPRTQWRGCPAFPAGTRAPARVRHWLSVASLIFASAANVHAADDDQVVHGQAPPDQAVLGYVRGGAFFVAKDLKHKYDELLARPR